MIIVFLSCFLCWFPFMCCWETNFHWANSCFENSLSLHVCVYSYFSLFTVNAWWIIVFFWSWVGVLIVQHKFLTKCRNYISYIRFLIFVPFLFRVNSSLSPIGLYFLASSGWIKPPKSANQFFFFKKLFLQLTLSSCSWGWSIFLTIHANVIYYVDEIESSSLVFLLCSLI